jgi:hypothetical protein
MADTDRSSKKTSCKKKVGMMLGLNFFYMSTHTPYSFKQFFQQFVVRLLPFTVPGITHLHSVAALALICYECKLGKVVQTLFT